MRSKAFVFVVAVATIAVGALGVSQAVPEVSRLLVVDETKTFASTMRVVGLVKLLKGVGLFEVDVQLVDVESSYDDPLAGRRLDPAVEPYDLMLIVPRGVDDGSVRTIWIVSDGLILLAPHVQVGVATLSELTDLVFDGLGAAIDVYEDLFPGFLWALYVNEGWMR
jgi:hypothetical protein